MEVDSENDESDEPEEIPGRTGRIFCPEPYRKPAEEMAEQHLCTHPLIPGYSRPTPEGIRYWAVKEMYTFCVDNDLPEFWAYLRGKF
jgi:hypothetical protein